jgi:hypothetical protein
MRAERLLWTLAWLICASCAARAAGAQPASGDPAVPGAVRAARPNDVGVEAFGRCGAYAISYQRMLGPELGLEGSLAALGSGSTSAGNSSGHVLFGTVGARLYLGWGNAAPFATAGAVLISGGTDAGPFSATNATGSYGYAGLGVEGRTNGGFLVRGTFYGLGATGTFLLWPGLQMGYAF